MKKSPLLALLVLTLIASGCATIREDRNYCIITGALIGAAAGGIAEDDNKGDAALGGAVVGGVASLFFCAPDKDGDGVKDKEDSCPMTPAGAAVDMKGCAMDSDRDGVADYQDNCPGTAAGVKVGSMGCAQDSDGDGVVDHQDQCPMTPNGTKIDAKGCALDADGDGIADARDQCPGTPRGRMVDSNGCDDDDKDGVANQSDQCPDTRAGDAVDARGCHVMASLTGLNFANDSATLPADAPAKLADVLAALKANSSLKLMVEGHTDSRGAEAYNAQLSERRAAAVREYLIDQGVSRSRLQSKGFGESMPATSNETAAGRTSNRRVDFTVMN